MKTEVYSWRLSRHLKEQLEDLARSHQKSMAELLEEITEDWLRQTRGVPEPEKDRQQRLREAALKWVGAVASGRPDRAESSHSEARERIARRHGR